MTKAEKKAAHRAAHEERKRQSRLDSIQTFFSIVIMVILIGSLIGFCIWISNDSKNSYENTWYEIEVIDKYDYLGSSFHIIGGRATEQEYHIIYKVTPLTDEARKNYYGNGEEDDEVPYSIYRKVSIGKKFKGHSDWITSYY